MTWLDNVLAAGSLAGTWAVGLFPARTRLSTLVEIRMYAARQKLLGFEEPESDNEVMTG